jgi:hypothetical protein
MDHNEADALARLMNARRVVDDPALLRSSLCCELMPEEVAAEEVTTGYAMGALRASLAAGRVGFLSAAVIVRIIPRIARSVGVFALGAGALLALTLGATAVAPQAVGLVRTVAAIAVFFGAIGLVVWLAWLAVTEPVVDEDEAEAPVLVVRRLDEDGALEPVLVATATAEKEITQ